MRPLSPEPSSPASLSLRTVTALELASVLSSVLLTAWVIAPLQPEPAWLAALPGLLALALIIHSQRTRGERAVDLGFTAEHFGRALKLLAAPTLGACALFVLIGYLSNSLQRTTHFWANVAFLPVWALLQQYVLQGFIHRRLRGLLTPGHAILVTAAIFALAHAPNLPLLLFTLAGAVLWAWVYQRAPNLFALALSHAALSLTAMNALPSWLLESLSVGYKHFLYQKF